MGWLRSVGGMGAILLLCVGAPPPATWAQAAAEAPPAHKSVYGKLESVEPSRNGVIMRSDGGERLVWRFAAPVMAELARFNPGDRIIVIYRQLSPNEKRVTAVAFPGAADTALYVNMTDSSVVLRSAPAADGACGTAGAGPVDETTIPRTGRAEAAGACWCCASAGETCSPGNKTGLGKAFLVGCFK
jgi:hypothetical protein